MYLSPHPFNSENVDCWKGCRTLTLFPEVPPLIIFAVYLGLPIMWDNRSTRVDTNLPLSLLSSKQQQHLPLYR